MRGLGIRTAAALLAGLGLLAATSTAAAPLNDIDGEYNGRMRSNTYVLDPESDEGGPDTHDAGMFFSQEGSGVYAILVLFDDEGVAVEGFEFEGRAWNGRFWISGGNEGGSMVLSGTMRGEEGRRVLKAKGTHYAGDQYSDLGISVREGDSGIEF